MPDASGHNLLIVLVFCITSAALEDKVEGVTITGVVACGQVAPNVVISYHGDKKIRQTKTDENGMFMMEGLVLTKRKPLLRFQYNCSNLCGFNFTFYMLKYYKSGEVYDFGPIQLAGKHNLMKTEKC